MSLLEQAPIHTPEQENEPQNPDDEYHQPGQAQAKSKHETERFSSRKQTEWRATPTDEQLYPPRNTFTQPAPARPERSQAEWTAAPTTQENPYQTNIYGDQDQPDFLDKYVDRDAINELNKAAPAEFQDYVDAEKALSAHTLKAESHLRADTVLTNKQLETLQSAADRYVASMFNESTNGEDPSLRLPPTFGDAMLLGKAYDIAHSAAQKVNDPEQQRAFAHLNQRHLGALEYIVEQQEHPLQPDVIEPLREAIQVHKTNPDTTLLEAFRDIDDNLTSEQDLSDILTEADITSKPPTSQLDIIQPAVNHYLDTVIDHDEEGKVLRLPVKFGDIKLLDKALDTAENAVLQITTPEERAAYEEALKRHLEDVAYLRSSQSEYVEAA